MRGWRVGAMLAGTALTVLTPSSAMAQTSPTNATTTAPATASATPVAPVAAPAVRGTSTSTGLATSTSTSTTTTTTTPAASAGTSPAPAATVSAATPPKVRGVGDSVFHSAQAKVLARLEPEYAPRFVSVLGATIADMTPRARRMADAGPAVMVLGLGNPDVAEVDESNGPDMVSAAQTVLAAVDGVPCVVWINLKQAGVNPYYNVNWERDATAFNEWLVEAATPGGIHFDNLHVLNWNRRTLGHPSWFVADGLHLNDAGQREYAAKLDRYLNRTCPP